MANDIASNVVNNDPVVILGVARTPIGSFQGKLAGLTAPELGAVAIREAVKRAGISPESVDEVLFGTCLFAGQKQAPARQAALSGGLPGSAGCTTLTKMCGSAMKAVMLGHDVLLAGSSSMVVAGGMESMSNAPYMLPRARAGYRLGHQKVLDHMLTDGLEDAVEGRLMGDFACAWAEQNTFTREEQDRYATESTQRAKLANTDGSFDWEIAPVTIKGRAGETMMDKDETPFAVNVEKIPSLKPAFRPNGTITPANASSISDGAAALVLTRQSIAAQQGLKPLARIVGHATYAADMASFPGAPVHAIKKLFAKTGWTTRDVDLFEVNEAFAVVALGAMRALNIPHEKMNVHGGACALGHPVGSTGARIIVTLIGALRQRGLKRGVASLCIGGGEATAIAIELL
ncbi:MAG: acetyl-CoA C-acyltransferase [Rugosibacter sp.]|nr:acetyl-CoA C-acyltransferase [Rugosibacter sp.]